MSSRSGCKLSRIVGEGVQAPGHQTDTRQSLRGRRAGGHLPGGEGHTHPGGTGLPVSGSWSRVGPVPKRVSLWPGAPRGVPWAGVTQAREAVAGGGPGAPPRPAALRTGGQVSSTRMTGTPSHHLAWSLRWCGKTSVSSPISRVGALWPRAWHTVGVQKLGASRRPPPSFHRPAASFWGLKTRTVGAGVAWAAWKASRSLYPQPQGGAGANPGPSPAHPPAHVSSCPRGQVPSVTFAPVPEGSLRDQAAEASLAPPPPARPLAGARRPASRGPFRKSRAVCSASGLRPHGIFHL